MIPGMLRDQRNELGSVFVLFKDLLLGMLYEFPSEMFHEFFLEVLYEFPSCQPVLHQ